MRRPVSASASLIAAIAGPTCSGVSSPACQPVPKRAVRRIAALLEPPSQSGSRFCTGLGAITAPR